MRHVIIPIHWSAEQAVTVVDFLEEVIDAIWSQHCREMSDLYSNATAPHDELYDTTTSLDDEIPF